MLIACSIHVWGQDFASKFMEQCAKEDGDIQCQTVSPIMMEKLMDTMTTPDGDRDEEVPEYLLSKLKSARIITATKQSEKLFREAKQLIEKNKNRFSRHANHWSRKRTAAGRLVASAAKPGGARI